MNAVPTLVTLYAYGRGTRSVAAQFRLTAGAEVTLAVRDPDWAGMAEQFFADGVPSYQQDRLITRDEPVAFMRALLEPRNMSYYEFVDESDGPGDTGAGPGTA